MSLLTNSEKLKLLKLNSFLGNADDGLLMAIVEYAELLEFDKNTFITFNQTVEMLIDCKLTCFYCVCYTPILYKNVRDGNQWTLDRTNNDVGHSYGNVVVSCLKCNLQRKRMSSTAFAMSKQMVITRSTC